MALAAGGSRDGGGGAPRRRRLVLLLVAVFLVTTAGAARSMSSPSQVSAPGSSVASGPSPRDTVAPAGSASAEWSSEDVHGADGSSTAWSAPAREVLDAFSALARRRTDVAVLVPKELPDAMRLLCWNASGQGPTAGKVVLGMGTGLLVFYEGMLDGLQTLPGRPCGLGEGRTGMIHRVFGGQAVVWRQGDTWYAVYGRAISSEALIRVASHAEEAAVDMWEPEGYAAAARPR